MVHEALRLHQALAGPQFHGGRRGEGLRLPVHVGHGGGARRDVVRQDSRHDPRHLRALVEVLDQLRPRRGTRPVVIELAALLQEGAPLATPVGEGATGTKLALTADLESQARTLHTAGADDSVVYGWNLLTGTAAPAGAPVQVELQGNVSYVKGTGPIFGFVTYTFADGSTLGVQMQGAATASADGSSTEFAATLGVIGGTGKYASATGTGIFTGSRQAALGATVAASFDLTIAGAG